MQKFNIGIIALLLGSSITSLSAKSNNNYIDYRNAIKYTSEVFNNKFTKKVIKECNEDRFKRYISGNVSYNGMTFRYSISCKK